MRKITVVFISGFYLLGISGPVVAGGTLKKLQGLAESATLQEEALKTEAKSYSKAEEFINSPDIKPGLSADFILERCGQPVARADHNRRWVYKPPSSTFFKGEKIYLIFDENNKLISWRKLHQK